MEPCTERSASLDKEQEALWYLGGLRIIQALGEQPKEDRNIFEYLEPARTSTFSYAPYQEDAAFYVIEGEAIFSSGKTIAHATPGTFLFLPRNPLVSPLYANVQGLPPTLLLVGSEEGLLSDSTRMADRLKAAGVEVKLENWPGMWHDFIGSPDIIPEVRLATQHIAKFIRQHVGA